MYRFAVYLLPFHCCICFCLNMFVYYMLFLVCRKSMDSVDSLDFYHGLSGQLPWTQRTVTMDSVDSLDSAHGHPRRSPVSPWTKSSETSQIPDWTMFMDSVDIFHGLSGHCPRSQWTVWTFSMNTLDKVQGVKADWTMFTDKVHDWTLSMYSLDFVQSDLIKKIEVKVASLEIYIHIFLSKQF